MIEHGDRLLALGEIDAADQVFTDALGLNPADAWAANGLARVRMEQGRSRDALALAYRTAALTGDPADASHACLVALHVEGVNADAYHRSFFETFVAKIKPDPVTSTWDGVRPLRVGYVSPFFRAHTTAKFLEPVIAAHDPKAVEVFIYSDTVREDAVTDRFKGYVGKRWRNTGTLDNYTLAGLVRDEGIDVLVDRADHTASGRRFGLFARRPAPVCLSYSGHPHPSHIPGLLRISDAIADPLGHASDVVRVEGCHRCYRPSDEAPDVASLPARANGFITFGAMNRAGKIGPTMAKAWGQVLRGVPGSRLKVLSLGGEANTGLRRTLVGHGIDSDRLDLVATGDERHYLDQWAGIDIGLDCWPYNGTTTTADALWQGVPTVSMIGRTNRERMSATILEAVGMASLVTASPELYVEKAVKVVGDLEGLSKLRAGMRDRMAPLLDGRRVARQLEEIFRGIASPKP